MKKITTLLVLSAVLVAGVYFSYGIPAVRQAVASVLPLETKIKLKRTFFPSSALRDELSVKNQQLAQLNTALEEHKNASKKVKEQDVFADLSAGATITWPRLAPVYSQSTNKLLVDEATLKTITSKKGIQYTLTSYPLEFLPTALQYGYKPLFYVDSNSQNLYAITGDGVVFKTDKKKITNTRLALETVPTNLRSLITDEAIFTPGWFSIKDLKIVNDRAYISYTKKVGEDYTLAILSADLNQSPLVFSEFFSLDDPVSVREPFNAHQIGGRIVAFTKDELLISTGDFRKYDKAQDDNSLLGKVFSINLNNKETRIISKGHRNAQGLSYDPVSDIVFSTEHGPNGGDEINLNHHPRKNESTPIKNYGWPISSYGLHYDSRFNPKAPLHKSHKEHGFLEPFKQFTPSIGISQIIKVPTSFATGFSNDYFASSMGLNTRVDIFSLHHFRMNDGLDKTVYEDIIKVGERIRDIEVLDKTRLVLALEGNGTPAIAILEFKNNVK